MKPIILISCCLLFMTVDEINSQSNKINNAAIVPIDSFLNESIHIEANKLNIDSIVLSEINKADQTYDLEQLGRILRFATKNGQDSVQISQALLEWLRENHLIYLHKSPTDVNQFRGFLLYTLGQFSPNRELLNYVKSELQFGHQVFNIAVAAYTARGFTKDASQLVPLLNKYLQPSFQDEMVDITSFELQYPPSYPTKARYEIIKTLSTYASDAESSVPLITQLRDLEQQNIHNKDINLIEICDKAINQIISSMPSCCQKKMDPILPIVNSCCSSTMDTHTLIDKKSNNNRFQFVVEKERKQVKAPELALLDQEGNKLRFNNLKGKPFILTFFYTSCTNPLKCAATVSRLAELQKLAIEKDLEGKIGIYGFSYDGTIDNPSILKSYGKSYGITYSNDVKLLVPTEETEMEFFKQLDIRVNYGHGSVNHHGIQLFVFDKKGKIAAIYDNYVWEIQDVLENLSALVFE